MPEDNNNKWRDMNAAEWRGKFGEKLDGIERDLEKLGANFAAVCAKVDVHDRALAVIDDRGTRTELGGRAKAIVTAAVIGAAASIIVSIIALIGG